MIKTKLIEDGILSCDYRLDERINNFIKDKRVVDIQFTSVNNRAHALITYIVEDEEDKNVKRKKGL